MRVAAAMVALVMCAACVHAVPASVVRTFGSGLSAAVLEPGVELVYYNYTVSSSSSYGVTTHFWATGGGGIDNVVFRYYIDGEAQASIVFTGGMAAGVGFGDTQAPWGTEWIGKGGTQGAWFHNFRIPFQVCDGV
jgi:hypothetical protein